MTVKLYAKYAAKKIAQSLLAAGCCLLPAIPVALRAGVAGGGAVCQARNIGGGAAAQIFREVEAKHAAISHSIPLGHGRAVKVTYDLTGQGNGTLRIANLLLRPYSEADLTARYQGHLLDVMLFPDTVTGYCSIAVSGIVEVTGEKDDAIVDRRPAFAVYRFTTAGTFVREAARDADLFDLTR